MSSIQQNPSNSNFWTKLNLFQKYFLIIFIIISILSFFIPLLTGSSFKSLFDIISIIGLISGIAGVFASIYQARGEVKMYPFLLINTVIYGIISYTFNDYGQVIQQFLFLVPIQVYGWFAWSKHMKEKSRSNSLSEHVSIKNFTVFKWVIVIIIALIAWLCYYDFLVALPEIFKNLFSMTIAPDPAPALDSLTTILIVFAMILTSLRYLEQWHFWVASNIGLVIFLYQLVTASNLTVATITGNLYNMISWAQYGVGSVYGLYLWSKMKKETK
ncbi:MAG: nicotinamide riboside transporter PnuC [Psittacicella sp.]